MIIDYYLSIACNGASKGSWKLALDSVVKSF